MVGIYRSDGRYSLPVGEEKARGGIFQEVIHQRIWRYALPEGEEGAFGAFIVGLESIGRRENMHGSVATCP